MTIKLKQMALLAEVIGGIGIIVSLLYLAWEVSQNTATQALANHLALSSQTADINMVILADAELSDIMGRGIAGLDPLDPKERARYIRTMNLWYDLWENVNIAGASGLLDDEVFANWSDAMCLSFRNPGSVQAWEDVRAFYRMNPGYVRAVEDCHASAP